MRIEEIAPPKNSPILPLSRSVFRLAFSFLGGLRVSGAENVPRCGGALLCPNHISDMDPCAILAAVSRNDFNALAKQELFEIPILGGYFRRIGALPVKRDSADLGALRISDVVLKDGRLLLVFPEGRCSQTGKLQTVQQGAMLLSLKSGAPIVPIGIRGTNRILPYGEVIPNFSGGGASVTFGNPIFPSAYSQLSRKSALSAMTADVAAALAILTGQTI